MFAGTLELHDTSQIGRQANMRYRSQYTEKSVRLKGSPTESLWMDNDVFGD